MSKFHLRTRGALEVDNPHVLGPGADGSTYEVAGRIDSLRDARLDEPTRRYPMIPCWHGHVAFDSVQDDDGRRVILEGHYVDEGTKFRFVLSLAATGRIRAESRFERVDVSSAEVIAAQEAWQSYKGLDGRNDSRDKLIHPCHRDRIWNTHLEGWYVERNLTADIYGDYRLV